MTLFIFLKLSEIEQSCVKYRNLFKKVYPSVTPLTYKENTSISATFGYSLCETLVYG